MTTHPFVRFPWVAGLAAGVAAAYRGDSSLVWVLMVWGSIFLSAHFFRFCRRAYEFDPPMLPPGYNISGGPFVAVSLIVVATNSLHWLGWYDFAVFPLGLVRTWQVTYGLYFLGCYLVIWVGVPRFVENSQYYHAVGVVGLFWKEFGVGGKGATITAGIASVIAVGTALNQNRNETLRRNQAHELEMTRLFQKEKLAAASLDQKIAALNQKAAMLDQKTKMDAHRFELDLRKGNFSFDRVSDNFVNIKSGGFFSTPRQTVAPPPPDDPGKMSSPREPFEFSWLAELTLNYPFGQVLFGCLLCISGCLVFWLFRRWVTRR